MNDDVIKWRGTLSAAAQSASELPTQKELAQPLKTIKLLARTLTYKNRPKV